MNKKWLSIIPENCQICGKPFGEYFIDGSTIMGPWGLMCEKCHKKVGNGLGIGKGQKYITKSGIGVDGFNERPKV